MHELLTKYFNQSAVQLSLPGSYDISNELIIESIIEFSKSGKDPLSEHMAITHLKWHLDGSMGFNKHDYSYSRSEVKLMKDLFDGNTYWAWGSFYDNKHQIISHLGFLNCEATITD